MDDHDAESGLLAGSLFLLESAHRAWPDPQDRPGLGVPTALAARYWQEGRHAAALALFQDVTRRCALVLGPRDIDTLVAAGNEAVTRARLEDWERALPQLASVAENRDAILGALHPLTLAAFDALGAALRLAGQTAPAWSAHQRAVAGRVRVLGRAHPETLIARLGLALTRADDGDYIVAADLLGTATQDAEAAPDTPALLLAALRGHLAMALAHLGRLQQAEQLLRRAVDELALEVGVNHPDAIALRSYLQQLPDIHAAAATSPSSPPALPTPSVAVPAPRPAEPEPRRGRVDTPHAAGTDQYH